MSRIEYTVPPEDDGRPLRSVLRGSMGLSASLVKRVKWQPDGILLDGRPARLDERAKAGQRVSVLPGAPPERAPCAAPPMPPVLYEDDSLLVLSKPAGLVVHPTAGHAGGTLFDAAMEHFAARGETGSAFCPVSRLDRYTSGVLCIAKNRFCAQRLSAQLEDGTMQREYAAVVCGSGVPQSGTVCAPIARISGVRRGVAPQGQRAVTHFYVLRRGEGRALVRLCLETGRTHQIRVHMAYMGWPVYGDFLYGTEDARRPGFALHAQTLRFEHPQSAQRMQISAPIPAWFDELLQKPETRP